MMQTNQPSNKPQELVERYLQSVRFWMPKSRRRDDLIAELGEDLRSQVDDKETELGHPVEIAEVAEILKRCGNPMIVAGRLGPKQHLIGPTLYPIYTFVLKMVLVWILVPVFLFVVGPINLAKTPGEWGAAIGATIGGFWTGIFIAAGVITLVFAALERTHAIAGGECKWDPRTLPPLQKSDHKTSMLHTVCEAVFGWIGLLWVLLLPHYPILVLGPGAAFLKAGPIWHTFYLPIVLLTVFSLLRPGLTLAKPQWDWFPPIAQLVQTVLTLFVLNLILNAVSHGSAQSLVMLTDAAKSSPQYAHVAAIVNASVLISLVCVWIGLCIAVMMHTWEVVKYFRKRAADEQRTLRLQML